MAEYIVGLKFNRLSVLDQFYRYDGKRNRLKCLCKCDCGNIIETNHGSLKKGETISCGCYQIESTKKSNQYYLKDTYIIGLANNTKKEFYIDLEDYDKIKDIGWSEGNHGYMIGKFKNKTVKMHRFILDFPEYNVDHKNRNKADNRKENLRKASIVENIRNRSILKNNTSGTTGVRFHEKSKKYKAYIYVNKKNNWLGTFENITDAIIVRLRAELKYFGIEFSPQRHLFEKYGIE